MSGNKDVAGIFENPLVHDLFKALGEGVIVADSSNKIVYLNTQAEMIMKTALSDLSGKNIHDCHRCPWKVEEVLKVSESMQPYRAEIPVMNRWLSVTASGICTQSGERAGAVMVVSDTTVRHHLEESLKTNNDELNERQNRLNLQLELAREIQKALMPPTEINFQGLDVKSWNKQSQIIGGDFCIVHPDKAGSWVLLGDVMGKGVFASQFVPLMHGFIREEIEQSRSPAEVLSKVNRRLQTFVNGRFTLFVTLVALTYDHGTKNIRFSCAGHESPIIIRKNGELSHESAETFPLGVQTTPLYHDSTVSLDTGDNMLIFSDGITEAFAPSSGQYGLDELKTILKQSSTDIDPFQLILNRIVQKTAASNITDDQSIIRITLQNSISNHQ